MYKMCQFGYTSYSPLLFAHFDLAMIVVYSSSDDNESDKDDNDLGFELSLRRRFPELD